MMRYYKRRENFELRFDPAQWNVYPKASCYTYALNLPVTERLFVGDIAYGNKLKADECDDKMLIETIKKEILMVGYNDVIISESRIDIPNYSLIYVSRTRTNGFYHFFRNDSGIIWSHKKTLTAPTRIDCYGNIIINPRKSAEEGFNIGYYIYIK